MATHSSILAWRIPGTEESGGLQSMGSQRVGHKESDTTEGLIHTCLTKRIIDPIKFIYPVISLFSYIFLSAFVRLSTLIVHL